jgi:hypothetical protein
LQNELRQLHLLENTSFFHRDSHVEVLAVRLLWSIAAAAAAAASTFLFSLSGLPGSLLWVSIMSTRQRTTSEEKESSCQKWVHQRPLHLLHDGASVEETERKLSC